MEEKTMVDFGSVHLKSLIVTNDKELYEKRKSEANIGVLLTPEVIFGDLYIIGITEE